MIRCRALTRRFGAHCVVDALDLDLPPGGRYALMGPNGAGKSTLLAMLSGLLKPTSGSLQVAGVSLDAGRSRPSPRVGVLPDRLGLFEQLTVEEHLDLTAAAHGLGRTVREGRKGDLLGLLGLHGARHRRAEHCSHGMRKKTALAMALLPAPDLLLLDEPFEGLDPEAVARLQGVLRDHAQSGGTLLFSCHMVPVVRSLATRCLLLREGRLALDVPVADLPDDLALAGTSTEGALSWLVSRPC